VAVRYEPGSVTLEITDDGPAERGGTGGAPPGAGHGVIGMRERVAVFGGEFTAGPRPGGGFRVFARLPFPEVMT
jgi:signal transduction histidine kinase